MLVYFAARIPTRTLTINGHLILEVRKGRWRMSHWTSLGSMLVFLAVFLIISAVGFVVFLRAYGDRKRALKRLRNLAGDDEPTTDQPQTSVNQLVRAALPKLGSLLFPNKQDRLAPLKRRLLQAGFY